MTSGWDWNPVASFIYIGQHQQFGQAAVVGRTDEGFMAVKALLLHNH